MGEILIAFADQDHDTHIAIHVMFMRTPLVMTSPQVLGTFYAHLQEHISMKARASISKEIQELVQKVQQQVQQGLIDPMAAQTQIQQVQQQMQNPAEMEKAVAAQELEIMKATLDQITPPGQDPMSDPLVQIRMREVEIKDKELQRKAQEDESQIMIEAARMDQRAVTDAARIESTEEIAENRNEVNRERIEVQRQGMMRRG